ncbi:MAG: hypothetical protein JOZ45_12945 [Acidobacteriaceae bacterium]|nr:hypothetical protein [Acidobacteriaceae bacterium]MBV9307047.1 hypothetical protein [Acidobacteriaceae bacterium]
MSNYNGNMEVGIKQAKIDLSKLVKAARQGQKVYLTNRDERVAEILAVRPKREPGSPLPGYGMFKDKINLEAGWDSPENMRRDTEELMKILNTDDHA